MAVLQARVRNVCRDHSLMQLLAGGNAHALVVHEGAHAFLGMEEFIGDRVVGNAGHDFTLALQRNSDGKEGNAVHEVRCAINRVDDEAVVRVGALGLALFLAQETITGRALASSARSTFSQRLSEAVT